MGEWTAQTIERNKSGKQDGGWQREMADKGRNYPRGVKASPL
jgi:hypothetical protein